MFRPLTAAAVLALCTSPALATGFTCDFEGLGEAGEYNAVAFDYFYGFSSEVQGKVAVGRDLYARDYGLGTDLDAGSGTVVTSGGTVRLTRTQIEGGDLEARGTCSLYLTNVLDGVSDCRNPDAFSAASLDPDMRGLSSYLYRLSPTHGTTYDRYGKVTLRGSGDRSVFRLDVARASLLNRNGRINTLDINAPAGSTVIINVANYRHYKFLYYMGFNLTGGVEAENILFNFYGYTGTLYVRGAGVPGSILAPLSQLRFDSGHIEGTTVTRRVYGSGEFHNVPFVGETCPPPETPDCPIEDLGAAGDYNVFLFEDFDGESSDIQGKAAIGGDAWFENYGIASKESSGGTVLSVGGRGAFDSVQIYGGDGELGGTCSLSEVGVPEGDLTCELGTAVFDTTEHQSDLEDLSEYLGDLDDTGAIGVSDWGVVSLGAGSDDVEVFNLDLDKITASMAFSTDIRTMNIKAGADQTVVINLTGDTTTFMDAMGFRLYGGVGEEDIVFNFPDTTALRVNAVTVPGSVLAPFADVSFDNGNIDGTLVAISAKGGGEFHSVPFAGEFCPPLSEEEEDEKDEKDDDSRSDDDSFTYDDDSGSYDDSSCGRLRFYKRDCDDDSSSSSS